MNEVRVAGKEEKCDNVHTQTSISKAIARPQSGNHVKHQEPGEVSITNQTGQVSSYSVF